MKKLMKLSLIMALISIAFIGCKKDELTSQEMIEGKWIITSSEILATVIPGDGSYLQFNALTTDYTGVDYKASDNTTGTFTYFLSSDASIITIVDTMSDGGSYNGSWDILELTETKFRIVTNTFVGSLKLEMSK